MEKIKKCRCGCKAMLPMQSKTCPDRWVIRCSFEQCKAVNYGVGLPDTIKGWNRLSSGFYR